MKQVRTGPFINSDVRKNTFFGLFTQTINDCNHSLIAYRSEIAVGLQCSKLTEVESVADKATDNVYVGKRQATVNDDERNSYSRALKPVEMKRYVLTAKFNHES